MNNLQAKYWYDVAMAATEDTKDAPKAAKMLEEQFGVKIATVGDIYKIQRQMYDLMTTDQQEQDYKESLQNLETTRPPKMTIAKAKNRYDAQERWQEKVGLVSKSYKLKKDLVDDFAKKCKENGESQAAAITRLMEQYIYGGDADV
ncbi:hypothetical protein [Eubacterium barkeri]|uniref:Uncharacterized protein n=1 Tax=Eubacterium barkeri TaxID=1528 RepID=A0A1H3INW8_EUBBA|nr:hypothetical protein [Eubacterium barkeri]SDY29400.1 hypothetical protein SAMN04488579_12424 [Eubacterium barkeri]